MFFRTVYKSGQIFLPFCQNARVWRTDRQTDGRTACSAVENEQQAWNFGSTDARISAIRIHLRQIYFYLIFAWVFRTSWL